MLKEEFRCKYEGKIQSNADADVNSKLVSYLEINSNLSKASYDEKFEF